MLKKSSTTQEKLQRFDGEIRRVHGRMFYWANRLDKLIKARSRLERIEDAARAVIESPRLGKPVDLPKPDPKVEDVTDISWSEMTGADLRRDDPLDVRNQSWNQSKQVDDKAAAEIKAAQQAKAKVKAKASSEKSKAKRRGELRKMPLTGKAALAAINEGK